MMADEFYNTLHNLAFWHLPHTSLDLCTHLIVVYAIVQLTAKS